MTVSDRSGVTENPGDHYELDAQKLTYTNPAQITGRQQESTEQEGGDRTYECLGCGESLDTFRRVCPGCNARSFATVPAGDRRGSSTPAGELLTLYARWTAPYNPYIPR